MGKRKEEKKQVVIGKTELLFSMNGNRYRVRNGEALSVPESVAEWLIKKGNAEPIPTRERPEKPAPRKQATRKASKKTEAEAEAEAEESSKD